MKANARWIPALLALPGLMVARSAVGATIDLSWGACSPIVASQSVAPGGTASLWVSVTGLDEPHRAYEFWILVENSAHSLPDAWRFEAGGCGETSPVRIQHLPPAEAAAACPALQGNLQSFQITAYYPAPAMSGFPATANMIVLANAYGGQSSPADPGRRFAGRILFDHASSVVGPPADAASCGGLEEPVTFTFWSSRVSYVVDGNLLRPFMIGNGSVVASAAGLPVPTESTTWGWIKGIYAR